MIKTVKYRKKARGAILMAERKKFRPFEPELVRTNGGKLRKWFV